MKQQRLIYGFSLLHLIIISLLLLGSCKKESIKNENDNSIINGSVTGVNIFGNLELSISNEEMIAAGYEYGDIVHIEGDGVIEEMDLPYVDNYMCVGMWGMSLNQYENASSLSLALTNASFYDRIGGVVNGKIQISMSEKNGFLDNYNNLTLERTSVRDDYASDEVFANFRMVTAGNIAPEKLYRSSKPTLNKGNTNRYIYSDSLAREAGVNALISLSDKQESWDIAMETNAAIGEYSMELYNKGTLLLSGIGVDLFHDINLNTLHDVMTFMLENEPPFLICCDLGKDRTGIFLMMLEILADAEYEEIESDYMKSYENFYHISPNSDIYNQLKNVMLDKMFYIVLKQGDVDVLQMNKMEDYDVSSFFPALKESVRAFFTQKVGLSESELDAIMLKLQN